MSRKIRPAARRLKVFALDPSLSTSLDTADVNRCTVLIPWEDLEPGPRGEYIEVIDFDPPSRMYYEPVDLDAPGLLAQDGLDPDEADPRFHQQMVYAIAMLTIRNFERALGRRALWSPRLVREEQTDETSGKKESKTHSEYVAALRIYPHAFREANAYYDPQKKALLFGYFRASLLEPGRNLPGGMVFTCLSHDIIAHEMTHALLDGLHPRFVENTNLDVLAFHEAFADIVALFQHFSLPGVLLDQIERTRGLLNDENVLAKLAQQFGEASGQHGALRDALGGPNDSGVWKRHKPDPMAYRTTTEPHARGALLVAAVFDAFLAIYDRRTADLYRIAGFSRRGQLPERLPIDLTRRLASEAEKAASHVLRMCIRALDYVPPVDVTFSDYLRGIVTADLDLAVNDDLGYRVAVIEAFRAWGIYPRQIRSLNEKSVRWETAPDDAGDGIDLSGFMDKYKTKLQLWDLRQDRHGVYRNNKQFRAELNNWIHENVGEPVLRRMGLTLDANSPTTIGRSRRTGRPALEVHSVRPARRIGPEGEMLVDLVIELTQRRSGYLDPQVQAEAEAGKELRYADFVFRGGCTLLVDIETSRVRYCLGKNILSEERLDQTRRFFTGSDDAGLRATYFGKARRSRSPFRVLHSDH